MKHFSTKIITLPHSLKWEEAKNCAQSVTKQGFKIIWDFNFPINSLHIDDLVLKSWEFTLDYFSKNLFPCFDKQTEGCILYKGHSDFGMKGGWWSKEEEEFLHFLEGKEATLLRKRIFCREEGFKVLKGLSPFLPETLPLFLIFQHFDLLLAERCFDYFTLCAPRIPFGLPSLQFFGSHFEKNEILALKDGFLLPPLISLEEDEYLKLEKFLACHEKFRVIPESYLTQEWHGLETLTVWSNCLTAQGKRKVSGFEVSGGRVIDYN